MWSAVERMRKRLEAYIDRREGSLEKKDHEDH